VVVQRGSANMFVHDEQQILRSSDTTRRPRPTWWVSMVQCENSGF